MTKSNTQDMKHKTLKRAGLFLILPITLGLAGVVSAHPRGEGGGPDGPGGKVMSEKMKKCHETKRASKIKSFDKDGDGKLSPEERQAAKAARKAQHLGEYDKNKDGTLSEAERAELRHDLVTEKFEGMDSNSDAEISLAEAEASCSPLARHFDKVDSDGDKSISWTEFEKGVKARRGGMKHKKRGMRGGKFRQDKARAGGNDA